jgi:hypothetical protein
VPLQKPAEIADFIVVDTQRNAELIKAANIKLE